MGDLIEPMLAKAGSPADLPTLVGRYVFDTKLDGVRGLLYRVDGVTTLRNRTGVNITDRYPEIVEAAESLPSDIVLDGEIVAVSGKFEDVGWRDKQSGRGRNQVPVRYVAFDVLRLADVGDVRLQPYGRRRQFLDNLALTGDVIIASTYRLDAEFFDEIRAQGGEGVIAKRVLARYSSGRSADWLKVKSLHSVTALATGYLPGNGSRSAMGKITLGLLETDGQGQLVVRNGRPVIHDIGKAGSGFSPRTAQQMKELMDGLARDGVTLATIPVVEVECLNVTRTDVLRQPVFKGLRTDVDYMAATWSQLADIPRS